MNEEPRLDAQEVDLKAYWQVLRKRRFTIGIALVAVVALMVGWTLMQTPIYQAQTKILAKSRNSAGQGDLLTAAIPAFSAFTDQRDVQTQVEIARSWPLMKEAARRAGIPIKEGASLPVTVEGGKDNNVITVTAKSPDPRKAKLLANAVAEVFVDQNLNANRSSARAGRIFLEGQQDKYKKQLQDAAKAVRDYQARTGAWGWIRPPRTKCLR